MNTLTQIQKNELYKELKSQSNDTIARISIKVYEKGMYGQEMIRDYIERADYEGAASSILDGVGDYVEGIWE